MKGGGLLNNHICKKNQISPMRQQKFSISTFPIMSCHSNQSSYPIGTKKTQLLVPSTYRCYMCNMKRINFMASEERSFENVENDGYLYIHVKR